LALASLGWRWRAHLRFAGVRLPILEAREQFGTETSSRNSEVNYWPGLPDGTLLPAYSGIRPRITGPTEPLADFHIDGPQFHGIRGLVNLFGIESPGLTASLAIADHVADLVSV
jgi:hypothetical protein